MANKRLCLSLLFFIVLSALCAQDAEFYSEMRFFQRLTWSGDEYAQFYEIIVEKERQGARNVFEEILHQRTHNYSIEVSLSPGKYRFRVIPFDFLDTQGEGTQWIEFEVYPAIAPQVHDTTYKYNYTGTEGEFVLNIMGNNIGRNAEINIVNANGDILVPDEKYITENGRGAQIVFYDVYSVPLAFTLNVTNPGGLGISVRKTIVFTPPPPPPPPPPPQKPGFNDKNDTFFGIAWMPLFVTYKYENSNAQFVVLEGAGINLSVINKTNNTINMGFELNLSWLNASSLPQFIKGDLNFMAQIFSPKNSFGFRFRLGAGAGISDSFDLLSFHFNAGFSFLLFVSKRAYIELGVDSVFWNYDELFSGGLRPFAGIGWRTNR
ncbi:MAG: hypothetical protein FWC01_01580 [Treponema sp.]|nr:hypothetical protein [Treponema sp.]MCL2236805.1 hypothetical protein [Treponema sp.]